MRFVLGLALLVTLTHGLRLTSTLEQELLAHPVTKVVNILKQMDADLQAERDTDQQVYDNVRCWCDTNEKDKTTAISEADARIKKLTSTIEAKGALAEKLAAEIKDLEEELVENQQALDDSVALREKENGSFEESEKDLIQAVGALKSAITVLGKHHGKAALVSASNVIKFHMMKQRNLLSVSDSNKKDLFAFLQNPAGFKSYSSGSGQIFGILENMLDTFEANLSSDQKEEMEKQRVFNEFKQAKEAAIELGQKTRDDKKQKMAEAKEDRVQAEKDLEETENSMSADQKYLAELRETCKMTDEQFAARTAARDEELKAVAEAMKILTSDDNRDLFGATFNFLQTSNTSMAKVQKLLTKTGNKFNDPKLIALATSMRLNAFTQVKKTIQNMIDDLLAEKEAEIKKKDSCNEQLHQNRLLREKLTHNKNKLEAKIDALTGKIKNLNKAIADLEKQNAETIKETKRAGENRAKENLEFNKVFEDQEATIKVLNKVVSVLSKTYEKKRTNYSSPAFAQQPVGPPAPAGFEDYNQNKKSGGVLGMLRTIIADAEAARNEAMRDEKDAQTAYESAVINANDSVAANLKNISSKTSDKAEADEDKNNAESNLQSTNRGLDGAKDENKTVHDSCDFTLKNFDVRQDARDEEVEALRQAIAILSGAM